jgi:ParB family transcriptional regulator, chromosome partitioning protein
MRQHTYKVWSKYFNPVQQGLKTFEIRKNDRNEPIPDVGDILDLIETEDGTKTATGNRLFVKVSFVLTEVAGLEKDYFIMGIYVI